MAPAQLTNRVLPRPARRSVATQIFISRPWEGKGGKEGGSENGGGGGVRESGGEGVKRSEGFRVKGVRCKGGKG